APRQLLTSTKPGRPRTCCSPHCRSATLVSRDVLRHIALAAFSGKPAEKRGRKATGLKRGAMTAGLPASYRVFDAQQGGSRPDMARTAEPRRLSTAAFRARTACTA